MIKVAFSADVSGHSGNRFARWFCESECGQHPSEHQGEVHAKGHALLQGLWRWGRHVSRGRRTECMVEWSAWGNRVHGGMECVGNRVCGGMECVGEWSASSVWVWSEWGDVWRYNGKPHF
jgi:hypothetical protein